MQNKVWLLLSGLFVDATGAYPVTESYGAQCGYTYSVHPLLGCVILRASYFSCHTDNQVEFTSIVMDYFQDNALLSVSYAKNPGQMFGVKVDLNLTYSKTRLCQQVTVKTSV